MGATRDNQTQRRVMTQTPQGLAPVTTFTLIAPDANLVGQMTTPGELQVSGRLQGDVRAGSVTVDPYGVVIGTIIAETVTLQGRVDGMVYGGRVRLAAGCRVHGDVVAGQLEMEHGAMLEGGARQTSAALPELPAKPSA